MASLPAQTLFTPEEYIAQERKALHKSEYLSGQIFAMSGASRAHSLITGNIFIGGQIPLRDIYTRVTIADQEEDPYVR